LIPEDGYFNTAKGFAWNRSHVLDAGVKSSDYQFSSCINEEHIRLIKDHGQEVKGLVNKIRISLGLLSDLEEAEDRHTSIPAGELLEIIEKNLNNLIEGEKEVAESFGINVRTYAAAIKYSPKTGRVSVKWQAETVDVDSAVRWAIIIPPNDINKRESVKEWLNDNQHRVEKQENRMKHEGVEINRWWLN
jgi:hypothetical protein